MRLSKFKALTGETEHKNRSERTNMMSIVDKEPRIGVYICDCGLNIAGTVFSVIQFKTNEKN